MNITLPRNASFAPSVLEKFGIVVCMAHLHSLSGSSKAEFERQLQSSPLPNIVALFRQGANDTGFAQWLSSGENAKVLEMLKSDLKIIRAKLLAPDFENRGAFADTAANIKALMTKLKFQSLMPTFGSFGSVPMSRPGLGRLALGRYFF
jgi:hypothetical protein